MVVLGISLGSRTTGIAIIKDKELLVARTLTLRNKQTNNHTHTLGNYIQQYKIMLVVIKLPPVTHITERIETLLHNCISLFQYHGCMVRYTETKAIKAQLPDLRNKNAFIDFSTIQYPELMETQSKELVNRQRYHAKMFEAVLIAHLEQHQ